MKQLQEVQFRFADDQQPYQLVSRLARNLQSYPPQEAGLLNRKEVADGV